MIMLLSVFFLLICYEVLPCSLHLSFWVPLDSPRQESPLGQWLQA
jgi:hypothetical protein